MKMKLISSLLGSSAALLLQIRMVSGDCFPDGDDMPGLGVGEILGHYAKECLNSTSYAATDSICESDGSIIHVDAVVTCPETNPRCIQFQCSDSDGQALCGVDDTTDVREIVSHYHYAWECFDSTSYVAIDYACASDGTSMATTGAVYTCPETNPYCIQCGVSGDGVALCLDDTTDVPSNCVVVGGATTTTATTTMTTTTMTMTTIATASSSSSSSSSSNATSGQESSGGGGCLVGDIMFMVGDSTGHIGLECINATSYKARESFCMADGTLQENLDAQFTCPESSSYCVQCGVAGDIGSALCLESAEVPSDCATAIQTSAPSPTTPATTEQTSPNTTSSGSIIMSVASMWIVIVAAGGSSSSLFV